MPLSFDKGKARVSYLTYVYTKLRHTNCVSSGVKEATEAFRVWQKFKEDREQIETEKNERKPPPFKFVKVCC